MTPEPLTIIRLDVHGFKRLTAVTITPKGSLVEIRGNNAQGKSSVLDAIEAALRGRDAIPDRPVNGSSKRAEIKVDMGGLRVERDLAPDGKTTRLKITSSDPEQPSTQAALDHLIGQISFDPYDFVRLTAKEQAAKLRAALGIDTRAIDQKRVELYEERTFVNREVKRLEGAVAQAPFPAGPDEPVKVADLLRELEAAETSIRAAEDARASLEATEAAIESNNQKIADFQKAIESLKASNATLEKASAVLDDERKIAASRAIDPAPIKARIADAESTNEVFRLRLMRRKLGDDLAKKAGESARLTEQIEEIDQIKRTMLEASNFPIPNLRLDDEGVWLNGEPISQASAAERLRFAVALGLKLNPTIRVLLIRDGSLLDDTSLSMVAQMAADAGAQVWLEKVSSESGSGWLIEDGMVAAEPVK